VSDLDGSRSPGVLDAFRNRAEAGDVVVAPNAEILRANHSARSHGSGLQHH